MASTIPLTELTDLASCISLSKTISLNVTIRLDIVWISIFLFKSLNFSFEDGFVLVQLLVAHSLISKSLEIILILSILLLLFLDNVMRSQGSLARLLGMNSCCFLSSLIFPCRTRQSLESSKFFLQSNSKFLLLVMSPNFLVESSHELDFVFPEGFNFLSSFPLNLFQHLLNSIWNSSGIEMRELLMRLCMIVSSRLLFRSLFNMPVSFQVINCRLLILILLGQLAVSFSVPVVVFWLRLLHTEIIMPDGSESGSSFKILIEGR